MVPPAIAPSLDVSRVEWDVDVDVEDVDVEDADVEDVDVEDVAVEDTDADVEELALTIQVEN